MKSIYFVHTGLSTFVESDLKILKASYDVKPYHYKVALNPFMKLMNIFKSFINATIWVWRMDVVFCWFVGYHAFFPILFGKFLRKKTIVIVGGFDANIIPSINYGIFSRKNILYFVSRFIYRSATVITPVDLSLSFTVNKYADPNNVGIEMGFSHFVRNISAKIIEMPTGYDTNKYRRNIVVDRKDIVLAMADVTNFEDYYRKGFDVVLDVAALMPETKFILAGIESSFCNNIRITPNVEIINFVEHKDVVDLFSRCKIFLQLSLAEGLPNALCEAMLCEMIPIGSNVNGIPKAIGNAGYIVDSKDPQLIKKLIMKILAESDQNKFLPREQIIKLFPLENRVKLLTSIINDV